MLQVFTNVPVSPVAVTEDAATGTTILTCSVSDGDSDSSPSGQHIFSITGRLQRSWCHTLMLVCLHVSNNKTDL